VTSDEILIAFDRWDGTGQVHLLVQPLLVHIRCRDIETAAFLRNLAHGAGLKFSTIRSIRISSSGEIPEWGTVVEFLGTERMEVPLHVFDRERIYEIISSLTGHINELLTRIKGRIEEIETAVRNIHNKY
jgi:tRNA(Phe) wybutosine-synthesizing methylase Tyw3